jgi:hypothetical protein
MNYEPGVASSSSTERPDKPLVVKCEYNTRRQKLIFKSARFCTYDGLKDQVLPLLVVALALKHRFSDRETLQPGCPALCDTMEGSRRRIELHLQRRRIE